jgi:uncharacterized phage protein (TIGR01671 family)
MNNLKFRVWVKESKYFIYPDNFGYMSFAIRMDGLIIHLSGKIPIFGHDNDYIIQQFTGLKDKNGREIYVGDIVKTDTNHETYQVWSVPEYTSGEIKFINWSYKVCETGIGATHLGDFATCDCCNCGLEIIGNVCENLDLKI